MVGLQTLDLAIGVRVPASQPQRFKHLRAAQKTESPALCAYSVPAEILGLDMEKHWYRLDFLLEENSSNTRRSFTAHACAASPDEPSRSLNLRLSFLKVGIRG